MKVTHHNQSPFTGLLFAVPFFLVNLIVSLRLEPWYSWLDSIPTLRNSPYVPLVLLLLLPIGAAVSMHPIFQKQEKVKPSKQIAHISVAALLLGVFIILFAALGEDFYRCEVLRTPNCD